MAGLDPAGVATSVPATARGSDSCFYILLTSHDRRFRDSYCLALLSAPLLLRPQGPIGHGEVGAEEALGNAGEYVVKITPAYSFYPQNTPLPLVKYSFWVM